MTLALASSLTRRERADAFDIAASYIEWFDPRRGYAAGALSALTSLSRGADPRQTGRMHIPDGSYGNGGAMRIAPLGLAYRNAPRAALARAVEAALLPTHVHPCGIDGALMQAAAVAWLSKRGEPEGAAGDAVADEGSGPEGLLRHLIDVVETDTAKGTLEVLLSQVQKKVGGGHVQARGLLHRQCLQPFGKHHPSRPLGMSAGVQLHACHRQQQRAPTVPGQSPHPLHLACRRRPTFSSRPSRPGQTT
jgi:hypothetical protein